MILIDNRKGGNRDDINLLRSYPAADAMTPEKRSTRKKANRNHGYTYSMLGLDGIRKPRGVVHGHYQPRRRRCGVRRMQSADIA